MNRQKTRLGTVISNKMNKTVVVAVTRLVQHAVYKKTIKKVTKFKAHDEENKCNVGDVVSVVETRPISKDKRWKILSIIEKA